MLKRTSLNFVNNFLKKKEDWKILDIGCGYRANKNATVLADVLDFTKIYKDKKFVQIKDKILPFNDKEFDFVIASHVIEHIEDFEFFIKEIERISSRGYIELPSRLGDNLVFENMSDHIWWFNYDDDKNIVIASKRNQLLEPFLNVSMGKLFENLFRESMVLEISWENKIEYRIEKSLSKENFKKVSFLTLIKKYFSKKIRSLYK